MKAYTDANRTQAVASNTEVRLNQKIWVELDADGLDESLVALVMDSCWATPLKSANASRKHYLIENGWDRCPYSASVTFLTSLIRPPTFDLTLVSSCPNPEDQTVSVEANGKGTSNSFSFNMFQFTGSSAQVYLHCKLHLCNKQENTCVKVQLLWISLTSGCLTLTHYERQSSALTVIEMQTCLSFTSRRVLELGDADLSGPSLELLPSSAWLGLPR